MDILRKVEIKIKIKSFIFDLLFELIVDLIILAVAFLFDRILETIYFYFSWKFLRYVVPKIFHVKAKTPQLSVIGCAICSIWCFILAMAIMLPINISLFFGVFVGILINEILYFLADRRDLLKEKYENTVDIYKLNEDELRNYAKSKGLSEMIIDTLVLKVIYNYKWIEIQKERDYTKEGIRYHKERIYKLLNVKF